MACRNRSEATQFVYRQWLLFHRKRRFVCSANSWKCAFGARERIPKWKHQPSLPLATDKPQITCACLRDLVAISCCLGIRCPSTMSTMYEPSLSLIPRQATT